MHDVYICIQEFLNQSLSKLWIRHIPVISKWWLESFKASLAWAVFQRNFYLLSFRSSLKIRSLFPESGGEIIAHTGCTRKNEVFFQHAKPVNQVLMRLACEQVPSEGGKKNRRSKAWFRERSEWERGSASEASGTRGSLQTLGSLSNDDDDAEDNAQQKMNLYFTTEIRDCLDLLGTPMALQTCLSQICKDGVQIQLEIRKISRRGPRSVDDAELGHFTLLLCWGRHGNVQRSIMHVHSYYFAD